MKKYGIMSFMMMCAVSCLASNSSPHVPKENRHTNCLSPVSAPVVPDENNRGGWWIPSGQKYGKVRRSDALIPKTTETSYVDPVKR